MSTYRLDKLFAPRSVAVVGASTRPGSLGSVVLQRIIAGGFAGRLTGVNPKYREVQGIACVSSLSALKEAPDLVVVATPAETVPEVIADAVDAGASTAIVLTAGLGRGPGSLAERAMSRARAAGLRIVGPNCLGMLSPRARLNASFAVHLPKPGPLALISQSGAIATSVVEWAEERDVGFSGVVSIGDALDVDFGDLIDHFAEDAGTRAILLYVEGILDARKFLSAARKAARVKPVIVLKSGRHSEGARAAATHTGALAGSDAVYNAAFHRSGCVRVLDLNAFFAAADTVSLQTSVAGERLAILTNGGGLGVLAVDRLVDLKGTLAGLGPETVVALDAVLPSTWSRANPVDIIGDAPPERYREAFRALQDDPGNDAILVMNCPTAMTSPEAAAEAMISVANERRAKGEPVKPAFAVWLGADRALAERFRSARIPAYASEAEALIGITQLTRIRRRHNALLRPPPELPAHIVPDHAAARAAIAAALAAGRRWLTQIEVTALMQAYGIPLPPVHLATTAEAAERIAAPYLARGEALALKIHSPDIVHKSDVDGVRLGLASVEAVRAATDDILARSRKLRPQARIDGVSLQPMVRRSHARELIVGMAVDPTFGPVILFGHGGTAVEVIDDKALALLPLDLAQARDLIAHTRIARLLAGYRNVPPVDTEKVAEVLIRVSRLVEDNPEVIGLDINPLLAGAEGVIGLDARVEVTPVPAETRAMVAGRRFAVRPYPRHLEQQARLKDGTSLLVRPMRPTDQRALTEMLEKTSPEDLRMRFLATARSFNIELMARLTQLDYAREMALVALDPASGAIFGVVRLHGDANLERGEYAILVRSDQKGRGIGSDLMRRIIAFARAEGYSEIFGEVLADNRAMLALCRTLGFVQERGDDGDTLIVRLELDEVEGAAPPR